MKEERYDRVSKEWFEKGKLEQTKEIIKVLRKHKYFGLIKLIEQQLQKEIGEEKK